jgi:hypothetical protein
MRSLLVLVPLALSACTSIPTTEPTNEALDNAPEVKVDDEIAASSVFVWRARGDEMRDFCNGVVLTGEFVATAASCVDGDAEDFRVGAAGATPVTVEKIMLGKGSAIAILKVKAGSLPPSLKPATLAPSSTAVSGKVSMPLYAARGKKADSVKLTKLSGEQDVQESMPGIIAVRMVDENAMIGGHEGSGIFIEKDGHPVLIGIVSRNSWRGQTCYTQDLRGQPLLAELGH